MKHYESTLATITSSVWEAKTATEAKDVIINYLEGTRIKDKDSMIATVKGLPTLTKVWQYFANALLKFEALGLNQLEVAKA